MPIPQSPEIVTGDRLAPPPGAVDLTAEAGRVLGLVGPAGSGLTRLGLSLLVPPSKHAPVAAVDVRGWLCPMAAWEVGIDPERLVVVRSPDRQVWPSLVAALLEGLPAVYAEVPAGVGDHDLRRLAALARARSSALVLRPVRGDLPAGVLHLKVEAAAVMWEGTDAGHGRLGRRRLALRASGRGARGIEREIEVTDDGADAVRVVPRLAPAPPGQAAG